MRYLLSVCDGFPSPLGGATVYFDTVVRTEVARQFDLVFLDLKFAETIQNYGRFSLRKIIFNKGGYLFMNPSFPAL